MKILRNDLFSMVKNLIIKLINMKALIEIHKAKDNLNTLIEGFIIEEVNKLFKRHKNLVSFSDDMGIKAFKDNKGESIYLISQVMNKNWSYNYVPTYKTFKNLISLYDEIDNSSLGINVNRDVI